MKRLKLPVMVKVQRCGWMLTLCLLAACSKKGTSSGSGSVTDTTGTTTTSGFNINSIEDTYADVAPFTYYTEWGPYNVHDPSIKKLGNYYYCYSTDVAYGETVRSGIQIRKSPDLVQWQFVGWVFNSLPPLGAAYITQQGGTPNQALWAPYIMQAGSQYRLYYSLSSSTARLSVIGLATATDPEGPWTEQGVVVTSTNDTTTQTNAIDPTVLTTASGDQYMYYGSAWDGIYILKLDPTTGLAATAGDKGTRIANRGFTNGVYNGNIEGSEIIYNPTFNKYYLFIAYDWLQTKYNTRVCRADAPTGPFLDINGVDANTNIDHTPMIIAPYQFMGHGGWQGTSHCTLFTDDSSHYYYASQARPAVNSYYMDLHVRKVFWTTDGWPVVSPERYAWEDNSLAPQDSLAGNWELINLTYQVVPGYGDQQVSPDLQVAQTITIAANGTITGAATGTWTYAAPWLQISWAGGTTVKVFVQKGRDWENKVETIIFTGLDNTGMAVWGKKR
jgi:arabinan endo-1,5-alpha-L-arabinosidase